MQNTRDQYLLESQQKYARFLEAIEEVRDTSSKKKKRKPVVEGALGYERSGSQLSSPQMQPAPLPMNTIAPKYRAYHVVLDSSHRNMSTYPNANDFVVKLLEPLRNVFAIRLLRTEFYQTGEVPGYFVVNQISIPIQINSVESAYLYLNGYIHMNVANESNTAFFGRIGPGSELYPSVAGQLTQDPHTYFLRPAESKLKRFHVRLHQADGSIYAVQNARVVITMAVYCIPMMLT